MIDSLIKIIEQSVSLLKYRQERRNKIFETFVTQTFNDFQVIHDDYIQIFESFKQSIADGTDLTLLVKNFAAYRLKNEALRQKIRSASKVYFLDSNFSQYKIYFAALICYLMTPTILLDQEDVESLELLSDILKAEPTIGFHSSYRSLSYSFFNMVSFIVTHQKSIPEVDFKLLEITESILFTLRENWKQVSEIYAELLIQRAKI